MKLTEDNYVEIAENVIKKLREKKDQKGRQIPLVTRSKEYRNKRKSIKKFSLFQ